MTPVPDNGRQPPLFKEGDRVRSKAGRSQTVTKVEWSPPQGCYFYWLNDDNGGWSSNVREYSLEALPGPMIQISFELDALAKALMEEIGGSWEHWCPECPHPAHYYGQCEECGLECKADGGDDPEKSGPIPWDKLPETGNVYEYGGRKLIGMCGKEYWRTRAEKLLNAL